MPRYAELIYNGFWFSPEREMLQAAIDLSQQQVCGTVRLKLYKGSAPPRRPQVRRLALFASPRHLRGRCGRLRPEGRGRLHQIERAAPAPPRPTRPGAKPGLRRRLAAISALRRRGVDLSTLVHWQSRGKWITSRVWSCPTRADRANLPLSIAVNAIVSWPRSPAGQVMIRRLYEIDAMSASAASAKMCGTVSKPCPYMVRMRWSVIGKGRIVRPSPMSVVPGLRPRKIGARGVGRRTGLGLAERASERFLVNHTVHGKSIRHRRERRATSSACQGRPFEVARAGLEVPGVKCPSGPTRR